MNSQDLKLKPTCGNCRHIFFRAEDTTELERCRLVGKYHLATINILAAEYCARMNSQDLCEYHEANERLKSRVDYSL